MGQWQSQEVCTTPACIHAASNILKGLNPDWAQIDACTDFDQSEQPAHDLLPRNPSSSLTWYQWCAMALPSTMAKTGVRWEK